MCEHGNHCWVGGVLLGLAWWLVSSGLLFLSWNKVVCTFSKVKPAKYWQALLLVATICVFCAPRHYLQHREGHGWGCGGHRSCHHEGKCPYGDGKDGDDDGDDAKPAPKK